MHPDRNMQFLMSTGTSCAAPAAFIPAGRPGGEGSRPMLSKAGPRHLAIYAANGGRSPEGGPPDRRFARPQPERGASHVTRPALPHRGAGVARVPPEFRARGDTCSWSSTARPGHPGPAARALCPHGERLAMGRRISPFRTAASHSAWARPCPARVRPGLRLQVQNVRAARCAPNCARPVARPGRDLRASDPHRDFPANGLVPLRHRQPRRGKGGVLW